MAPQLRIQYPGAIYHARNHGDSRETIFLSLFLLAIRTEIC